MGNVKRFFGKKPQCLDPLAVAALVASGCTSAMPNADGTLDAAPTDAVVATDTDTASSGDAPDYALRSGQIATAICNAMAGCCKMPSTKSEAATTAQLLNPGKFLPIATAASAGQLILDPARDAECQTALAAVATLSSKDATEDAVGKCLSSWVDSAAVGAPCHAASISCARGAGVCAQSPVDGTILCVAALGPGEACGAASPCRLGDVCFADNWGIGPQYCAAPNAACSHYADNPDCGKTLQCDIIFSCDPGFVCNHKGTRDADTRAAIGENLPVRWRLPDRTHVRDWPMCGSVLFTAVTETTPCKSDA